jgi:hypothetical protein
MSSNIDRRSTREFSYLAEDLAASGRDSRPGGGAAEFSKHFNDLVIGLDDLPTGASSNAAKFHRVWTMADRLIDQKGLWPSGDDRPEVTAILEAMSVAPIVGVDILDIGDYESGTADKWIATLAGGQKVVMKLNWYVAAMFEHARLQSFKLKCQTRTSCNVSGWH